MDGMPASAILLLACIAGGVAFIVLSMMGRRKSGHVERIARFDPESLRLKESIGAIAAISGVARAPETMRAPVSGKPCIFYEERLIRRGFDQDIAKQGFYDRTTYCGGFFIEDGGGKAFVVPAGSALIWSQASPRTASSEKPAGETETTTERIIEPGQAACAGGMK